MASPNALNVIEGGGNNARAALATIAGGVAPGPTDRRFVRMIHIIQELFGQTLSSLHSKHPLHPPVGKRIP